jgi:hypothetical protein
LEEKINENFKNKTKHPKNDEFSIESKCLNYDSEFEKAIEKNLNKITKAEAEFEKAIEELNYQQANLKKNMPFKKEELEAYAVKNLDELKSYESDLKNKFAKAFDAKSFESKKNESNDEQISNIMELLLDDCDTRFILQNKNTSVKTNQLSIREHTALLEKDYEYLKDLYEKEQTIALEECESIAEKLKDCHIVYSNNK